MTISMTAPFGTLTNLPDGRTQSAGPAVDPVSDLASTVSVHAIMDSYGPITIVTCAVEPAWCQPVVITQVLVSGVPASTVTSAA